MRRHSPPGCRTLAPQNAADVTGVPLMSPSLPSSDIKGEESRALEADTFIIQNGMSLGLWAAVSLVTCAGPSVCRGRDETLSWLVSWLVSWSLKEEDSALSREAIKCWSERRQRLEGILLLVVAVCGARQRSTLAVSELQWLGPPPQHQPITARQAEKIFCILCPEGQTCKPCLARFGMESAIRR